jgi:hypothetical protein
VPIPELHTQRERGLAHTEVSMRFATTLSTAAVLAALAASEAAAHGYVGQRFFPATIATEDPFVADELSLPTVSVIPDPDREDEPLRRETDVSLEVDKRILPNLGIGIGETWTHRHRRGTGDVSGFGNLEVGAKYNFLANAPHELLLSVGLDAEVGGSGQASVGADPFSTISPGLLFGKGFGDLPETLGLLRPFAVTGTLGFAFPTEGKTRGEDGAFERNPNVFETGIALEYSVPYLQASVRDIGLRWPFNRLIPLVELGLETGLDRGEGGHTTGTVQPGILWTGTYFQLGAEAVIPLNRDSGRAVGAVVQLHFYLDDLFPRSVGKPLFGGR